MSANASHLAMSRSHGAPPARAQHPQGSPRRSHQHPYQSGRSLVRPPSDTSWRTLPEVKVRVNGLPGGCETSTIHSIMQRFGDVVRIDIRDDRTSATAWVTFQPPPQNAFWDEPFRCANPAGHANWSLGFTRVALDYKKYPSPVRPGRLYNELTSFIVDSLDFGFMLDETTMMKMQTTNTSDDVHVVLNLRRKQVDVRFSFQLDPSSPQGPGATRKCRFRMPISQLHRVFESNTANGQRELVIPFNAAPQFYMQAEDLAATHSKGSKLWSDWPSWSRQTDVVAKDARRRIESQPVQPHKDSALIDLGRWTTYRFVFHGSAREKAYFEFRSILVDHNVQIVNSVPIKVEDKKPAAFWDIINDEMSTSEAALYRLDSIALAFPVRYQLEVLFSNGWVSEHNIGRQFLERLAAMEPTEAQYILERAADKQVRFYDPMEVFKIPVKEDKLQRKIPPYCVVTRAVNITPTTMHAATPLVETSNRIVRQYAANQERFLRVKFADEKNEGRINSQMGGQFDRVFERIRRAMLQGIVVAGRYYRFLAFGNSQFREHGAYFVAPSADMDPDRMRRAMGSFEGIKSVSKFNARHGQCFSTTRKVYTGVRIVEIDDVERNGYCFTDGVGKISIFLAQMSSQELGLPNSFDDHPSLFQFRLAGCKGVLAVDPALKANEVHIRPSQYKFKAENKALEVIRSSALATACFNRQLIILLSSLGVPDRVFQVRQEQMMKDLQAATENEDMALTKLQRNIDVNQMSLTLAAMVLDGFMTAREPFMMSLLHLWRAYNIKYLKEKARIIIEKGAFVLGCVDETATLRGHEDRPDEGREAKLAALPEIFLQITDLERRGHYKIVEGVCILARNPSLHAGDLRVVRAVNVPQLRHLKNVVVLPQTGDRDLANMCSGGDLDGDDYLIMWDDDFLPPGDNINEDAMDFTPVKAPEVEGPITVEHIADFFVQYIKNDSLARIALAHLAQADASDEGVRDEKCLELAQLHSQAVDYPKNGVPAVMPRELVPRKFPHFMPSKYRPPESVYKSTKILGQLFDQVELVDFKPQYRLAFDARILQAFELDDALLDKARALKESYDAAMQRIMAKHGIRTEFEVWSAFVLEHNQEQKDYSFAEELGRTMCAIQHQFRSLCRHAAGAHEPAGSEHLSPFVAAMYTVTAQEMAAAIQECDTVKQVAGRDVPLRKMEPGSMPLISFPWLFGNELGRLATGREAAQVAAFNRRKAANRANRKQLDSITDEPLVANIETQRGVTHLGELLGLFSDAPEPKRRFIDENHETEPDLLRTEAAVGAPAHVEDETAAAAHDPFLALGKELFEHEQRRRAKEKEAELLLNLDWESGKQPERDVEVVESSGNSRQSAAYSLLELV